MEFIVFVSCHFKAQLEGSHRDLWIMPWVAHLSHSPLQLCGPASTAPLWTNLALSTARCAVCLAAKIPMNPGYTVTPPGTAVRAGVLPCIPAVLVCLTLNSPPPSLTVSGLIPQPAVCSNMRPIQCCELHHFDDDDDWWPKMTYPCSTLCEPSAFWDVYFDKALGRSSCHPTHLPLRSNISHWWIQFFWY